ncbi:MAG: hypothetical protein E4G93_04945 [Dehalococcoidia bacterium]|nr:MAG: hypothetical protein E4G93_04945 [Dehalococcoidia bacterium]
MSSSKHEEGMNAYAGAIVCTLVLVVGWVISFLYVPPGWPVIAVNGLGYALSVIIMAGGYAQLKRAVRPFIAFLIASATWLVIVLLVRMALLQLFAVV